MKPAIIVAALGYFVDVFDILLFSILRVPSLRDLGLNESQILEQGLFILNLQLAGLILGGILWGIWGDRYGRLSVLFASILLYSIATIGCAFVQDVTTYSVLRFVAGFGLAGELGVGITLVAELLSKEARGWGTTLITGVGVAGAIGAAVVGQYFDWRTCYAIGGGLGLALLLARFRVAESGAFLAIQSRAEVVRGDLRLLFSSWVRTRRFLLCILIGFPIMYVVYIPVTFSPELGRSLGFSSPVSAASAVMFCYIGITVGDLLFGSISQLVRSRKRASLISLVLLSATLSIFWLIPPTTSEQFYGYAVVLGLCSANWAVLITTVAEQFGTNLRATATTAVPNLVRGSAIFLTMFFQQLKGFYPPFESVVLVGFVSILIAMVALLRLEETYGVDLDFIER
jgi:MFS family permease